MTEAEIEEELARIKRLRDAKPTGLAAWPPWLVIAVSLGGGFLLANLAILWGFVLWRVLVPWLLRVMS